MVDHAGIDGVHRRVFEPTFNLGHLGIILSIVVVAMEGLLHFQAELATDTADIRTIKVEIQQQHNDIQTSLNAINSELVIIDAKLDSKADKRGWEGPK